MFPKLIGQRYISEIENTYGRESWQFLMWVMAKFPISALERRVITRAMCIKFHAFELPQFGNTITKLFAMDAAYSAVGGDRCIGMELAFGRCTDGISRVAMVGKPMLIPVSQEKGLPEDQIAKWVMEYCTQKDIPPRQVFFDGTGRSSLMYAFGRLWSPEVVPLEFGGMATDRPAPADPRKTCRDLYGKFVTELWYVTRTLIESDQCRGMTDEVCQEGCLRAWTLSKNGKADVEPKDETKLRLGRSPDLFDTLVSGVEGARRLGFTIGKQAVRDETGRSELLKLRQQWSDVLKSRQLTNA
jgi:hypothetical protein